MVVLLVSVLHAQTVVLNPGDSYQADDTAFVVANEQFDQLVTVLRDYRLLEVENAILDSLNRQNEILIASQDSLLALSSHRDSLSTERILLRDKRIGQLHREKRKAYILGGAYGVIVVTALKFILGG